MFSTAWRLPYENDRRLKKPGSEQEHLFFPVGSLYIFSGSVSRKFKISSYESEMYCFHLLCGVEQRYLPIKFIDGN
ncbi:unnamed protein product [Brugia pahangi]|uniref:Ovule protein n=1 Tax=Brugia pahangi TaxID=6280 RepID=A0A0N4TTK7_BRUPA|nr:unnamed protein product [Brugia pahangi]